MHQIPVAEGNRKLSAAARDRPTRKLGRAIAGAALLLGAGMFAVPPPAWAQGSAAAGADPNSALGNEVLTVARGDYSIAGLVTRLPQAQTFKHGIALFPGYPSIMKLREEAGQPRFELGGNFLVRSRRHWLDDETLVMVVDAPSDQWSSFSQRFRQDPRYGADVAALLAEAGRRYGLREWTLVGTSEGTVSAFHAARMNPALAPRLILTASLFVAGGNGPGLSDVTWEPLSSRLLWVHHEGDPCYLTPYREAQRHAESTRSPLLTVRGGGPARGGACQPYTAHGFVGVEREVVAAMLGWIKTGQAPAAVTSK
jgi:hypothetical protein